MAHPDDVYEEARRLRSEERKSFPEILQALPVKISKGTLSIWLKDLPLTENERLSRRRGNLGKSHQAKVSRAVSFPARAVQNEKDTKRTGDVSELAVMMAFAALGYQVLKPFGDNARYDLVIDKDGKFIRIQVKTGRIEGGSFRFHTTSVSNVGKNKGVARSYVGQVEFFAVYVPEINQVYMIPVEDTAACKRGLQLRLDSTFSNRRSKMASAYLLTREWNP